MTGKKKVFWWKKPVGENRLFLKAKLKIELNKDIDASKLTLAQVKEMIAAQNSEKEDQQLKKRPLRNLPPKKHPLKRNKLWNSIFCHQLINEIIQYIKGLSSQHLGSKVAFHTEKDFPDIDKIKIAIIGVLENRGAVTFTDDEVNLDAIRKELYSFTPG